MFIDMALIAGGRNLLGPLGWVLVWFDVISHEGWPVALPGVILSLGSVYFIYFVAYKLLIQVPDGASEETGGEPLPETQDSSASDGFWLVMMTVFVGPLILPPRSSGALRDSCGPWAGTARQRRALGRGTRGFDGCHPAGISHSCGKAVGIQDDSIPP